MFDDDKKKDKPCANNLERIIWSDLMNVVSGNECTGLMPHLPLDFEEVEAYSDIYSVPAVDSDTESEPSDHIHS